MFLDGSVIVGFSGIVSIVAIILAFLILNKVYQEQYKRPWFFIGLSAIFLVISQMIQFAYAFFGYEIVNLEITGFTVYSLQFISITLLAFGLLLEYFILKFFKGKFVKMKLIPVKEGTLDGDIDLDVQTRRAYFTISNYTSKLREEFSMATRKGFEGFLITHHEPRDLRFKYGLQKTPILHVQPQLLQQERNLPKLDENTERIDPLQLNKMVQYIDNFLEQSDMPFLVIEIDELIKVNDFSIFKELMMYIAEKTTRRDGVFICSLSQNLLRNYEIEEMKEFLITLNIEDDEDNS